MGGVLLLRETALAMIADRFADVMATDDVLALVH
jgi:hypothetical protein